MKKFFVLSCLASESYTSIKYIVFIFVNMFAVQEYERDGIDWKKVQFKDNQECLDLIEKVIYSVSSLYSLLILFILHMVCFALSYEINFFYCRNPLGWYRY